MQHTNEIKLRSGKMHQRSTYIGALINIKESALSYNIAIRRQGKQGFRGGFDERSHGKGGSLPLASAPSTLSRSLVFSQTFLHLGLTQIFTSIFQSLVYKS